MAYVHSVRSRLDWSLLRQTERKYREWHYGQRMEIPIIFSDFTLPVWHCLCHKLLYTLDFLTMKYAVKLSQVRLQHRGRSLHMSRSVGCPGFVMAQLLETQRWKTKPVRRLQLAWSPQLENVTWQIYNIFVASGGVCKKSLISSVRPNARLSEFLEAEVAQRGCAFSILGDF